MKLTVDKILCSRVLAAKAFRDLKPRLSMDDVFKIIDNLPYIEESCWYDRRELMERFTDVAIFSYEKTQEDIIYGFQEPYWKTKEYLDAKAWYDGLSQEDRNKVDILTRHSGPVAC